MKVDLIKKYKWYIFGAIAVVLIMSIGLSFCAWDNNSIKNLSVNGGVSDYKPYSLVEDNDKDKTASVGDIVAFGNYYQQANETDKTALEWRVVDIRKENNKDILYLLTEKAIASGTFYGKGSYYDEKNSIIHVDGFVGNQCYNDSTLRAWLNSEQSGSTRSDGGISFANPPKGELKIFNGFYNEAFSASEKSLIIPRIIPSMYGYSLVLDGNKTRAWYPELPSEKVWTPSYSELFGANIEEGDSLKDKQFQYFTDSSISKAAFPTAYNKLVNGKIIANFGYSDLPVTDYNLGLSSHPLYDGSCYWLTRTPVNPKISSTRVIGTKNGDTAVFPYSGEAGYSVRPAICLEK